MDDEYPVVLAPSKRGKNDVSFRWFVGHLARMRGKVGACQDSKDRDRLWKRNNDFQMDSPQCNLLKMSILISIIRNWVVAGGIYMMFE